jgi:putative lipoic acid-binding regulatory protein
MRKMELPQPEVYDFPTAIPLKVIGKNLDDFEGHVMELFLIHIHPADLIDVDRRLSSGDSYLSVTVTFTAHSRDHLDLIYRELGASKRVMMVI